jgi:hypothetical protein
MKHIATVAPMLNLGVAGVYADQKPVTMTFSGTSAPSTINLQYPSTNNSEDNTAGNGTLGPFTFRNVRAINAVPEPSSTCSGPTKVFFSSVAGAGVFSFQDKDGSQLKVKLIQAGDCIDFQALQAHYFDFSTHWWSRPFQECVRLPYFDRVERAGVVRQVW